MDEVHITQWGDGVHGTMILAAHRSYDDAVRDLPKSLEVVAGRFWGSRTIQADRDERNDCWRCTTGTAHIMTLPVA